MMENKTSNHVPNGDKKEIKCRICREKFSTKASLKLHTCFSVSDKAYLAVAMDQRNTRILTPKNKSSFTTDKAPLSNSKNIKGKADNGPKSTRKSFSQTALNNNKENAESSNKFFCCKWCKLWPKG